MLRLFISLVHPFIVHPFIVSLFSFFQPAAFDSAIMFVEIMIAKIEEQSDVLKEFPLEASVRRDRT